MVLQLFGKTGKKTIQQISIFTGLLSLVFYSVVRYIKPGTKGRAFVHSISITQIYFTGVQAVQLISLLALALGVAIIFQVSQLGFGIADRLGEILVIVIIRQLGPLLTAILVIARSGTAISTEIANMVVKHETEALETMGIDTLLYIVLPRIIGMVCSLLLLNIIFYTVAIAGGVSTAMLIPGFNLSYAQFFDNFFFHLTYLDFLEFILKSVFFGVGISVICIINGFKVLLFPGGVPVSGIKGVVGSLIYVFFIDAVLTVVFFL